MPSKQNDLQEGTRLYPQRPFPLRQREGVLKKSPERTSVRSPKKIPQKILDYFRVDLKTGLPLSEEKRVFLSQVFMHELDEGIHMLERAGLDEQAHMLRRPPAKVSPLSQLSYLRKALEAETIKALPPEDISEGLKIRNNQDGKIKAFLPQGPVAATTFHGLFYKDHNEDALLIVPERGVLAVLDGMGGHVGGNIASGIVADFLEYGLKSGMSLSKAITFANEAVIERTRSDPRLGGMHPMGTTLVSCQIEGNLLKSVHVGDSKLLVLRGGRVLHASRDHTNGQDLLRDGLVDPETAHYLNHILSRSLGCDSIFASRDLESSEIALEPGDRVLLASDGITDNFFSKDFSLNDLAQLAGSGPVEEAIEKILSTCLERVRNETLPDGRPSKADNLTVLLYEHRRSPLKKNA